MGFSPRWRSFPQCRRNHTPIVIIVSIQVGDLFHFEAIGNLEARQDRGPPEDRIEFKAGFAEPQEGDFRNQQSFEISFVMVVNLGCIQDQPGKTDPAVFADAVLQSWYWFALIVEVFPTDLP